MIAKLWAHLILTLGLVIFAFAMVIALASEAKADVTARCAIHLAGQPGTTAAADRRYHLEHGEESPCTEADARGREGEAMRGASPSHGDDHQDEKSRYCRKHWYC